MAMSNVYGGDSDLHRFNRYKIIGTDREGRVLPLEVAMREKDPRDFYINTKRGFVDRLGGVYVLDPHVDQEMEAKIYFYKREDDDHESD